MRDIHWNLQPSLGPQTAVFDFSSHLIHFSVCFLGWEPKAGGGGRKNDRGEISVPRN